MKGLESTQREVSAELGERQAHCQGLRRSLERTEEELAQAEETKRQVIGGTGANEK